MEQLIHEGASVLAPRPPTGEYCPAYVVGVDNAARRAFVTFGGGTEPVLDDYAVALSAVVPLALPFHDCDRSAAMRAVRAINAALRNGDGVDPSTEGRGRSKRARSPDTESTSIAVARPTAAVPPTQLRVDVSDAALAAWASSLCSASATLGRRTASSTTSSAALANLSPFPALVLPAAEPVVLVPEVSAVLEQEGGPQRLVSALLTGSKATPIVALLFVCAAEETVATNRAWVASSTTGAAAGPPHAAVTAADELSPSIDLLRRRGQSPSDSADSPLVVVCVPTDTDLATYVALAELEATHAAPGVPMAFSS